MGTRLSKIAGTLTETSGEELARQQGLPAAPTSPLGMQAVGGSQDIAKMAGTPNQVRATIRETLKERTDVRDVMGEAERGSERKRFDVERIQQQLQSLTGLGSLDNRVAEAVRARLTSTTGIEFKNEVDRAAVEQVMRTSGLTTDSASVDGVIAALVQLRDNMTPDNVAAMLKKLGISATIDDGAAGLAQKLVQSGVFKQASIDDVKSRLSQQLENVKNFKIKDLGTVDDTGKVVYGNLDFDPKNAADALGLTEEQMGNLTLAEAKAMLASYRQRSFADVDELRDLVANPFATQGQKDFARKRLAELGAIGVTSLEEKNDDLQAQMEQGDTVQVGNRQIRVTELTTDPTYRATIATALSSPEELEKLRLTDPKLADWIDANKKALIDVASQLTTGLGDFATKQKAYKDYMAGASPDLLDKLIPGWRDAKDVDLTEWSKTLPAVLKATFDTTDSAQRGVRLAALQALLPLSTDFIRGMSTAALTSIVNDAGGDVGKAAELAKAWYQSTLLQPEVEQESFGLKFVPTDSAEKGIYDDATQFLVERVTGTKQSLAQLIDSVKAKLNSDKATDRQEGIRMLGELSQVKALMNNRLTQTNIKDLKDRKDNAARLAKEVENKNKEVQAAQNRTSLTPKPMAEIFQMMPEQRDWILSLVPSFKGAFSPVGDWLRKVAAGESVTVHLEGGFVQKQNPTLDDVILHVANEVRGLGSGNKHYSSASWASGILFTRRDELESQARQDVAALQKQQSDLNAERNNADKYYNDFFTSLARGG